MDLEHSLLLKTSLKKEKKNLSELTELGGKEMPTSALL